MRLFLLAVLTGVLTGCSKGDDLKSAALKVQVHYEGFRPGCVTLTVTDQAEVSRTVTTNVNVSAGPPPGTLSVAVARQAGWSNDVKLQARAQERSCEGNQVASAETTASLAKDGITAVDLSLSAVDGDGDGFVSSAGGTDCDDLDANQGGPVAWYPDDDNDGYGNRQLPAKITACNGPALTASRHDDCNDQDRSVHPDQAEFRCDGKDDNCDDVADEVFSLGATCLNDFQCQGAKSCNEGDGGVTCTSTISPTAYYFDEDKDGQAGADGGMTCGEPPPGTVSEFSDCDESSKFVNKGLTEVCDRLDNDCDGEVDEGTPTCDLKWDGTDGNPTNPRWNAIAVGQDVAWVAGVGAVNVVKINPDSTTTSSTCPGSWNAAWVSKTGELFLAGDAGKLAKKMPNQTGCDTVTVQVDNVPLNGIVGFDSTGSNPPTLYAVASDGHIYKWVPGSNPAQIATTGINLRAVHAVDGPETMLAVGAKDFNVPAPLARVVHFVSETAPWTEEQLPQGLPSTVLNGVHVMSGNYAYAVGNSGILLERNHGVWRQLDSLPSKANLTDVLAFSQNGIYATSAGTANTVQFFNGKTKTWTAVYTSTSDRAMRALDGTKPTRFGASGDNGVVQTYFSP
ncbi:MopE-related protein [Corallococcus interemptor]|uniref:MopE-related protein n=1 Tax=Corallococcus interemptor TaxID=2316720 RepID=UPI003D07BA69